MVQGGNMTRLFFILISVMLGVCVLLAVVIYQKGINISNTYEQHQHQNQQQSVTTIDFDRRYTSENLIWKFMDYNDLATLSGVSNTLPSGQIIAAFANTQRTDTVIIMKTVQGGVLIGEEKPK